mgnify:CR=1 FL=1|tara:strand:- start:96 stop:395 length:300 start_codon:yes stop_codon:yes gene_type:complete
MKKSKLKILLIILFLLCSCASSGNIIRGTITSKGIQHTIETKNNYIKIGSNKESCVDVSEFCEKQTIKVFTINQDSTCCSCSYSKKRSFIFKKLIKALK